MFFFSHVIVSLFCRYYLSCSDPKYNWVVKYSRKNSRIKRHNRNNTGRLLHYHMVSTLCLGTGSSGNKRVTQFLTNFEVIITSLTKNSLKGNVIVFWSRLRCKLWNGYSVWNWKCNMKYRIYPKYSDTSTPYHICSKIWTSTIHYPMLCLKIAGWVANSVDPDETPRSAASHLGLYCLLRPVCPNTYGKYGNAIIGAASG